MINLIPEGWTLNGKREEWFGRPALMTYLRRPNGHEVVSWCGTFARRTPLLRPWLATEQHHPVGLFLLEGPNDRNFPDDEDWEAVYPMEIRFHPRYEWEAGIHGCRWSTHWGMRGNYINLEFLPKSTRRWMARTLPLDGKPTQAILAIAP